MRYDQQAALWIGQVIFIGRGSHAGDHVEHRLRAFCAGRKHVFRIQAEIGLVDPLHICDRMPFPNTLVDLAQACIQGYGQGEGGSDDTGCLAGALQIAGVDRVEMGARQGLSQLLRLGDASAI